MIPGIGATIGGLSFSATGGGGGFTPADLGTALKGWYKGDTLTGSNTDPIATWPDGSGNASDATQVTSGARPTLVTANLNGLNVIRFTSANGQYFDLPDIFSGATAGSLYLVIKKAADPAAGAITDAGIHRFGNGTGASSSGHMTYLDGVIYSEFGTTTRQTAGDPTPSLASWRIIGIHSANADYGIYIDGVLFFATSTANGTGTNTVGFDPAPKFGRSVRDPTGITVFHYMDGWTAEMVLINAKLGTTDRQKLEGFLAWKWGLQGNLDVSHPYKSSPP